MSQTLETLRKRMGVAEDLHSVVRMMKALSAVSITQFQKAVESLAEYVEVLEEGLQILLHDRPEFVPEESAGRLGVVLFGSDQGMCGNFNEQIVDFAWRKMATLAPSPAERRVLVVGLRAASRLEDLGQPLVQRISLPGSVGGIPLTLERVLVELQRLRSREGVGELVVFHNQPRGISYRPTLQQLLPVDEDWLNQLRQRPWLSRTLPLHTLDWKQLFAALVRQHLFLLLYRACAESLGSENASRLACMQAAEKNVEEHLRRLKAEYHQGRQQTITEELLDVVSGYESLIRAEG